MTLDELKTLVPKGGRDPEIQQIIGTWDTPDIDHTIAHHPHLSRPWVVESHTDQRHTIELSARTPEELYARIREKDAQRHLAIPPIPKEARRDPPKPEVSTFTRIGNLVDRVLHRLPGHKDAERAGKIVAKTQSK